MERRQFARDMEFILNSRAEQLVREQRIHLSLMDEFRTTFNAYEDGVDDLANARNTFMDFKDVYEMITCFPENDQFEEISREYDELFKEYRSRQAKVDGHARRLDQLKRESIDLFEAQALNIFA